MARIIDVIQVANQGATDLVTRQPEDGPGDFRLGSQVIVRESQRAIFYRDGKSLDMFEAGRHTITTYNIPLLAGLLRLATSGDDIFTAEVYFVNMREFTDLKWGTPQPISLRDEELETLCGSDCGHTRTVSHQPDRGISTEYGDQPYDRCVGRKYGQPL